MGMSGCVGAPPQQQQRPRPAGSSCRCAGCPRAAEPPQHHPLHPMQLQHRQQMLHQQQHHHHVMVPAAPVAQPQPLHHHHHHHQTTVVSVAPVVAHHHKSSSSSKMKVLKKIKKKIGLGRSSCVGGSTGGPSGGLGLPPLGFHSCHGDNVRISRDGSIARRVESFCKGVVFSSRPVAINEKVTIRFTEMSTNWSGVLRFGFTSHDPAGMIGSLPKYACPDLTNKPGNWAKALAERLCDAGSLLQYHVTPSGDVHFSVDGDDKGVFFSGVDTKTPLWALLDVYGNCTGVQLVDSRQHQRLNNALSSPAATVVESAVSSTTSTPNPAEDGEFVDRCLVPALRATSISDNGDGWRPARLHATCGKHVRIDAESGLAARVPGEFCQGYVFTARPLGPGERLLIRILDTEVYYAGALALGLTSCDPARLAPGDLPNDSDLLLDRPEYWVVSKDVAGNPRTGEELALTVSGIGEVKVSRNGEAPVTVMHVDHTLRLWAFLDIYGSTRRVQVLTRPPPAVLVVALPPARCANGAARPNHAQTVSSTSSAASSIAATLNTAISSPSLSNHRNQQSLVSIAASVNHHQQMPARVPSCGALQQQQQHHIAVSSPEQQQQPPPAVPLATISTPSQMLVAQTSVPSVGLIQHHQAALGGSAGAMGGECTICYEQQIDSVLYMCGHMCMCYRCAVQQWRGKGGGQCPMCRAPIRDVIRTYKS